MPPGKSEGILDSTSGDGYTVEYIPEENSLRITVRNLDFQFDNVAMIGRHELAEDENERVLLEFHPKGHIMSLRDSLTDEQLNSFQLSRSAEFSLSGIEVGSVPHRGEIWIDIAIPSEVSQISSSKLYRKCGITGSFEMISPDLPEELTIQITEDIIDGKGWSEFVGLLQPTYFETKVLRELLTYRIKREFFERDYEPSTSEINGILNVVGKMLSDEMRLSIAYDG